MTSSTRAISIFASLALALGTAAPAFAIDVPTPGSQSGSGATSLKLLTDTSEYGGTEDVNNPDANNDDLGDNLAFTVPSALNFVVKANGDLLSPSAAATYVENKSAYGIHVSSVDVDAASGWNLVADAGAAGVISSNAVSMNAGPAMDTTEKINLASYTSKTALANGTTKWGMSAAGNRFDKDQLHLVLDGKAKNITADLSSTTEFATIHWYLASGGEGVRYVDLRGNAVAVLLNSSQSTGGNDYAANTLVMCRTYDVPTGDLTDTTVTDVDGNTYTGQVYTNIENQVGPAPSWSVQASSVVAVDIPDNQIIQPKSCGSWFKDMPISSFSLPELDTSKAENMPDMFKGCTNLASLDVSGFDTSNVSSMTDLFKNCSSLTSLDLSGFDTSNVLYMGSMFCGCTHLNSLDLRGFKTSKVTSMSLMFHGCSNLSTLDVSGFDTSDVELMDSMFYGCSNLSALDVSGFVTSKVTKMNNMFNDCSKLTFLDVSGFDTSNVTDMSSLFYNCSGLTSLDVSDFKTPNVKNMNSMFYRCSNLTSLDVSGFDTTKVTYMNDMFNGCSKLTALDVSGFDTANVTNMNGMFCNCSRLASLDLSGFNTANVTRMNDMFNGSGLASIDVSAFDISKVKYMARMFTGCSELVTIYALAGTDWSESQTLVYSESMFSSCSKLVGGNNTQFDPENTEVAYARIDGLGSQPGYFTVKPQP